MIEAGSINQYKYYTVPFTFLKFINNNNLVACCYSPLIPSFCAIPPFCAASL